MAEKKQQPQSELATTRHVVYPGPHPHVSVKNVGELGDLYLERGKPVELPAAIAADLIKRKKVKAAGAAAQTEAPAAQAE